MEIFICRPPPLSPPQTHRAKQEYQPRASPFSPAIRYHPSSESTTSRSSTPGVLSTTSETLRNPDDVARPGSRHGRLAFFPLICLGPLRNETPPPGQLTHTHTPRSKHSTNPRTPRLPTPCPASSSQAAASPDPEWTGPTTSPREDVNPGLCPGTPLPPPPGCSRCLCGGAQGVGWRGATDPQRNPGINDREHRASSQFSGRNCILRSLPSLLPSTDKS